MDGLRGLRDGTIIPTPQDLSKGKQYFVMHPRIKQAAQQKLKNIVDLL